jgi:hypothetical protein
MSLIEGVAAFTKALETENVPYGVIGGIAVFAYGGERTTFDIDFLIHGQHRAAVKDAAKSLNLQIAHENPEVIHFSGPVQIDVIFANRPASQAMLSRLRHIHTFPYPVVGPEDLVGLKIQAFVGDRSREFVDKGDILSIVRSVPNLDFDKIKEYADIFNVWPEIVDLKKRV